MSQSNGTVKVYTLTPEIKEQLREIAPQLHPLPVHIPKYKEVDGIELMKKNIGSIKKGGKSIPVIAGKKYVVRSGYELKDMNHIENLFAYYKNSGVMGVHGYMVSLVEHEQRARENFPQLFEDNGKGKYFGSGNVN